MYSNTSVHKDLTVVFLFLGFAFSLISCLDRRTSNELESIKARMVTLEKRLDDTRSFCGNLHAYSTVREEVGSVRERDEGTKGLVPEGIGGP